MKSMLTRFLRDESGATAIEYSVVATGISIVIVGVVQALGIKVNSMFTTLLGLMN